MLAIFVTRKVGQHDVSGLLGADAMEEDEDEKPKKMLPEYQALQQETKDFEIKVKEFYGTPETDKEGEKKVRG